MFKIGKIKFSSNKTVLIAEAGVNHNGSIKFAKKLIDKAKQAGCDIIKFQTYKAEKLTTKNAPRFWNWSPGAYFPQGAAIVWMTPHMTEPFLALFGDVASQRLTTLLRRPFSLSLDFGPMSNPVRAVPSRAGVRTLVCGAA